MRIFVSLGSGEVLIPLRVLDSDTIGSLKLLSIQGLRKGRCSTRNLQLVYGGRELSRDNSPIKDYGVAAGDIVHLLLRSSDQVSINATTSSGEEFTFTLDCSRATRVKDLKHRISERHGSLAPNQQHLLLRGNSLDDSSLVSELELDRESQLSLFIDIPTDCSQSEGAFGLQLSEGREYSTSNETPKPTYSVSAQTRRALPFTIPAGANTLGQQDLNLFEASSAPGGRALRDGLFSVQPLARGLISGPQQDMLSQVRAGLGAGHVPILSSAGSGGCYFMPREDGLASTAVFKPIDEEPLAINCPRGLPVSTTGEGLKAGTRVGEGAMREVAAYVLDYPFEQLEKGDQSLDPGFSGVPLTMMVEIAHDSFHIKQQGHLRLPKLGSLQQYVEAYSNCEDMGPSKFPVEEVHKIAVLDIRLANTDRNGSNILVCGNGDAMKLVPIDHGYCLPEKLEDCTFEWLYWPQAKVPVSDTCRKYISTLDAERDLMLLEQHGWPLSKPCARVLRVATLLLKAGTKQGLTLYEIGSMMVREHLNEPSTVEKMILEAEQKVLPESSEEFFLLCFQDIMEARLSNHASNSCAEE